MNKTNIVIWLCCSIVLASSFSSFSRTAQWGSNINAIQERVKKRLRQSTLFRCKVITFFWIFTIFPPCFLLIKNSPVPSHCCQEQHGRGGSHGIERPCCYCGMLARLGDGGRVVAFSLQGHLKKQPGARYRQRAPGLLLWLLKNSIVLRQNIVLIRINEPAWWWSSCRRCNG